MDSFTIILTVINIAILIISTYSAFRRGAYQNVTDDSQAAINFRKMAIDMQAEVKAVRDETKAEVKEARAETQAVKELLDKSKLEVSLSIELGQQPFITSWRWLREEDKTKLVNNDVE